MEPAKKPSNDIRVRFNSRISGIINYCQRLFKEHNLREITMSAVGGSIGTLVTAVEVLKSLYPGIHQMNRFATISYQSVEEGKKDEVQNERLFPKLEVKLSLDKPAKIGEGYQEPISEEQRKKILEMQNKRRQRRTVRRGPPRRGMRNGGWNRPRGFRGRGRGRNVQNGRGRLPRRGRQPVRGRGNRGGRGRGPK